MKSREHTNPGPRPYTLVLLAQPFGVLIFSRIVFGEEMTAVQLLFGILLLVGAACSIWARRDLPVE